MSGIFGTPKMPAAQPLPVQPTIDDARQAEEDLARLRKRRGRASTFLAGTFGRPTARDGGVAASMLGGGGGASVGGSTYTGSGGSRAPRRLESPQ